MSAPRIEIWGTFDVANVGDLLYPLVLENELRRRGTAAEPQLGIASPYGGAMPMGIGRPVRSITPVSQTAFAEQGDGDGIVLGGGDILRVGPEPAGDLVPGATGLYRYDAFIGQLTVLASATSVVWNGVGVPSPFDPGAAAVVRLLASRARYVSVRDETSQAHLLEAGVESDIAVVPDPAFVFDRVFPRAALGTALHGIRDRGAYPVSGPVLAFHVSFTSRAEEDALTAALRRLLTDRAELQLALIPLGPCHGDIGRMQQMAAEIGERAVALDGDVGVVEILAAIANADAFVGSSLHGNIIAARYGVPSSFLALKSRQPHKLTTYSTLLGRERVLVEDATRLPEIAATLLDGGSPVDPTLIAQLTAAVDAHYDRVAGALEAGTPNPHGRESLRADAVRFADAIEPARIARASAEATLAGHVQRLSVDLRAAIDARDAAQANRQAPRTATGPVTRSVATPIGAEPRSTTLAARGRAFVEHRRARRQSRGPGGVLAFDRIRAASMHSTPYRWAVIGNLYDRDDRRALIDTYPDEPYATIAGHDGEKGYEYEGRSLVAMGGTAPWRPDLLSESWLRLATDLCSQGYRDAISEITGRSLDGLTMEANVFHYGPGAWLGPHVDLREKILTHVLYFNARWESRFGGCLRVLRSGDETDQVEEVLPVAGNSFLLVRSNTSWHSVTRVVPSCTQTRRSVTVSFYAPDSISTMWPPGSSPALHRYPPLDE